MGSGTADAPIISNDCEGTITVPDETVLLYATLGPSDSSHQSVRPALLVAPVVVPLVNVIQYVPRDKLSDEKEEGMANVTLQIPVHLNKPLCEVQYGSTYPWARP